MMILKSLGNLEACTTFDVALDTANIKKIEVTDYAVRKLFQDDLKFIKKKSPTDLALINALQHVINKPVVLMKIKHRLKYTLQKYWHWA